MELWIHATIPLCDMPGYVRETHISYTCTNREIRDLFGYTDTVVCPICLFSVSVFSVCLLFFACNDVVACVLPWMFTDTCMLKYTAPTANLPPFRPGLPPSRRRRVTKHDC